jgi:ABC-type glycerol-3-phosphate transport system substrate-binding protein
MRLMLLRPTALLLALTALTACSPPEQSSTASTSKTEATAATSEEITTLKAVALNDALPYSTKNGDQ